MTQPQNFNRVCFLQEYCNKYGDFKVATHFEKGDWSKHVSVMHAWHNFPEERWRLESANNRQILSCETVLDFDPEEGESQFDLYNEVAGIILELKSRGLELAAYKTGSRGVHVHIFSPELALMSQQQRQDYRKKIIQHYKADIMKASDNCLIALENVPHWKTGQLKQRWEI